MYKVVDEFTFEIIAATIVETDAMPMLPKIITKIKNKFALKVSMKSENKIKMKKFTKIVKMALNNSFPMKTLWLDAS